MSQIAAKKEVMLVHYKQLEDVEVTVADHMQKVMKPNFSAAWEEITSSNELEDTYALSSMKTVEGKIIA